MRSPSTSCSTRANSSDVTTKLLLEYDGTDFAGWARQPERRTVQEELEAAIATILQEHIPVTVAGRIDAGVHAWGQVVSYDGDTMTLLFEEAGFRFPVSIPWLEAAVITGVALATATLAGLGPALHTMRLRIPEAIAYE